MDPVGQVLAIVGLACVAGALNEASTPAGPRPGTHPVRRRRPGPGGVRPGERRPGARDVAVAAPVTVPHGGFAATAVVGVLLNLGYYGILYLTTLYFQNQRRLRRHDHRPRAAAEPCAWPDRRAAVRAADARSARTGRWSRHSCSARGLRRLVGRGPDTLYPALLFALIATGLATPMTVPAATAAIIESAPAERAGVASAVFNVSRQIGNAVGVACRHPRGHPDRPYEGLHVAAGHRLGGLSPPPPRSRTSRVAPTTSPTTEGKGGGGT